MDALRVGTYLSICVIAMAAAARTGRAQSDPTAEEPATSGKAARIPVRGEPEVIVIAGDRAGPGDLIGPASSIRDAGRFLDEPVFLTLVHVDERAGETATIATVLSRAAGATVRSLGGLGGFSALSVRGSPPGHTVVLVDGVPLSRIASVGSDLGRYELSSFSRVELHRGGVPVEYGGAGLGGALNLVTALGGAERPLSFSVGAGSFRTRHVRGRWRAESDDGRRAHQLSLGYNGTRGDFRYFNDNGTNLDPSDDRESRRVNNDFDRIDGVARMRIDSGGSKWTAGTRFHWKSQGVPGSGSGAASSASLDTTHAIVDARLRRRGIVGGRKLHVTAGSYLSVEHQRYRDLLGSIGVGAQNRRYWTVAAGASAAISTRFKRQRLTVGAEQRFDYFREQNIGGGPASPRAFGARSATALSIADEVALAEGAWVFQPALRLELLHTVPLADSAAGVIGEMALDPRTDLFPAPRLSTRYRLRPGVVAKATVGRYYRVPTVVELFGDRGFIVGSPELEAEVGESIDAGFVVAPTGRVGAVDRIYFELGGFSTWARNSIGTVSGAGAVLRAQNLGRTTTAGVESAASLRLGRAVTLSANYTFLATRQRSSNPAFSDRELPLRPRHDAYWRVDVGGRAFGRLWTLFSDVSVASRSFLDAANLRELPPRTLLGAGARVELYDRLLLALAVRNLADQRVEQEHLDPAPRPGLDRISRAVADYAGYPLPGRAFYLTLEWEPPL